MAHRRPNLFFTLPIAFIALLAGCGGGGGSSSPSQQTSLKTVGGTVTSADGNASLVVANNVGVNASVITLQPDATPPSQAAYVPQTAYVVGPGTWQLYADDYSLVVPQITIK